MKKHAPKLKDDAPLAVAVSSLIPTCYLWNTKTGTLDRVYGGFVSDDPKEDSAYIKGPIHKRHRQAEEFERYECEINLLPLPDTIEEVILSENPECQLLITDCKIIPMPEVKDEPKTCKVIEHPAAWYAKAKKLHQVKRKDDNQLFLFPPPHQDLMAVG